MAGYRPEGVCDHVDASEAIMIAYLNSNFVRFDFYVLNKYGAYTIGFQNLFLADERIRSLDTLDDGNLYGSSRCMIQEPIRSHV